MTTTIELEAPRYKDIPGINEKTTVSKTVLRMKTSRAGNVRLLVFYCPADGMCRREMYGPIVSGLYAGTFALPSVTAASFGNTREIEHEVQDGDILEMDGILWQIRDDRALEYPHLYPLAD